jgi:hypothetical protein
MDPGPDGVYPTLAIGATAGARDAKAWRIPTSRIGLADIEAVEVGLARAAGM